VKEPKTVIYGSALNRAEQRPDELAFQLLGKNEAIITNRRLIEGARRYASLFKHRGIGPGDIVVLMLDHCADQYFSFLGAMLIGAIPTFMPPLTSKQIPALYWSAHAKLFDRIKPAGVVSAPHRLTEFRTHIPTDIASITPEEAAGERCLPLDEKPTDASDLAFLQHSSGTTQLKKGVQLTHRAVLAQAEAYGRALKITGDDRVVSWLPLYHDMGLIACFMLPLIVGIPVISIDPFEWVMAPDLLMRAIEDHRCTLTWLPNFAFHHLVRTRLLASKYDLTSMRAWIDCSEPCYARSFDLFIQTYGDCGVTPERLQVCYAMAETVFAVSQTTIGQPTRRLRVDATALRNKKEIIPVPADVAGLELLSAGHVLQNLAVQIVDDGRKPVPSGHVGEIVVSGEMVSMGYYQLPQRTAEKFKNGAYYTGDRGFIWNDELYVLGRQDDLIILNGRNFYCHELEYVVSTVPPLKPGRAVAFSVDDDLAGTQAAVVVVEGDGLTDADERNVKRQIREALLSQCDLTIREVTIVPPGWIVKTTSGKISRTENRAKYLKQKLEI
jgi:fatty-acyl-CoA synthase